jgi:predicted  nucleic acid-binding Zn-ribbon protein
MAKARGTFVVPRSFDPEGKRFATSINDSIAQLKGEKGNKLDSAVTFRDLIDAGIAKRNFSFSSGGSDFVIIGGDEKKGDEPTVPTGVSANGAFENIIVGWDYPTYRGHSHTEVWVNTSDTFGTKVFLASVTASVFVHQVGINTTRYYWLRNVSADGRKSGFHSLNGVSASTAVDVGAIMQSLGEVIADLPGLATLNSSITVNLNSQTVTLQNAVTSIDTAVDTAQAAATAAQSTASTAAGDITSLSSSLSSLTTATGRTIRSASAPTQRADSTSLREGDIWIETDNNNQIYIWTGSAWSTTSSGAASSVDTTLQSQIDSNELAIESNAANILLVAGVSDEANISTSVNITTLNSAITDSSTGLAANATGLSQLTTRVSTAESDISTITSDITELESTLTGYNGTSTVATAVSNLQTQITANDGDITSVTSSVTSLTNSLATTDSNVSANTTSITGLTNSISTINGTLSTVQTDITALESDVTTAEGNITSNTTAISGLTTRVTATESSITTIQSDVTTLNTDLTTAQGSISTNSSAITALQSSVTANDNDITSINSSITSLTTSVNNANTNISSNSSAISGLDTRVTQNESDLTTKASATSVTALQTSLNTLSGEVDTRTKTFAQDAVPTATAIGDLWIDTNDSNKLYRAASATADQITSGEWELVRDGAIASNSSAISTLQSTVSQQGTDISSNSTSITSLQNSLTNTNTNVSANASAISTLDSTVTTQGNSISSISSSITALQNDLTTLEGDVGTAETNITANSSAISGIDSRLTSAEGTITSQASSITALQTAVTSNDSDITGLGSSITSLQSQITANDDAIDVVNTSITSLTSRIEDNEDNISGQSTAISSLQSSVNQQGTNITANASAITQITSDVSGVSASVTSLSSSVADIEGNAAAAYVLQVAAGSNPPRIGGMVIENNASAGTGVVDVTFQTDSFQIVSPTGAYASIPFIVRTSSTTVNGETVPAGVYMSDAFIQNGTITNAKIGDAAIDDAKIANLDAGKISAGTIDAARIDVNGLITANSLVVEGDLSTDGQTSIHGGNIQTSTISANKLTITPVEAGGSAADINANTTTIEGGKITANTITVDNVNTDNFALPTKGAKTSGTTMGGFYYNDFRYAHVAEIGTGAGFYQGYVRAKGGTGQVKTVHFMISDGSYGNNGSPTSNAPNQVNTHVSTTGDTTELSESTSHVIYKTPRIEKLPGLVSESRLVPGADTTNIPLAFRYEGSGTLNFFIYAQGDANPAYVDFVEARFIKFGVNAPAQFTFTDQFGVVKNTVITSNTESLGGSFSSATAELATGSHTSAEFKVNNGAYSNASRTVSNGDTITLRITSSSTSFNTRSAILKIGETQDTWTVTTGF